MKNTELENSQMNVEETDKLASGKIVNQREIKGTPFTMLEIDDGEKKGKFVAWGKNRVSKFLTDEEAGEMSVMLSNNSMIWEVIGAMSACIAINVIEENKSK